MALTSLVSRASAQPTGSGLYFLLACLPSRSPTHLPLLPASLYPPSLVLKVEEQHFITYMNMNEADACLEGV